jgi:hypothetical protein
MRKILTLLGILVLSVVLFWSCHLEDFNLDKLATPKDIKPMVYAPLAYGNYKVGDILTTPYADNDTITDPVTVLDPIMYDKTGVSLVNDAIDSLYLMVNFTNGTPMKMQILFKFIDLNSGAVYGKTYDSGIMQSGKVDAAGRVIESVTTRVEFPMDSNDLNNISSANGLEFNVRLFQPDNGVVIVKNLKESLFDVQLSFRAPLSLWKL